MTTLSHPQYVPRRNEIEFIKQRAADRPNRQRQIKQRYIFKYFLAITLLWLIPDSNVRYYYSTGDLQSLLIFHGLQLISLIIYYLLTISDPGYLPINDSKMQQSLKDQLIKAENDDTDDVIVEQDDKENATLITKRAKPVIRTVDLTAAVIPPRFCERCKIYKPPRCKHCYLCDRCVIRYDHHCPLIDHCIGVNNYRTFMSYLMVQGSISLWTFCVSIHALFLSGEIYNYIQYGLRIVLFVWMLYQCIIASTLIIFHLYAISTAQTSFDHINNSMKKRRAGIGKPPDRRSCCIQNAEKIADFLCCKGEFEYDKGLITNWMNFLLHKGNEDKWYKPEFPIVIGEF